MNARAYDVAVTARARMHVRCFVLTQSSRNNCECVCHKDIVLQAARAENGSIANFCKSENFISRHSRRRLALGAQRKLSRVLEAF